MPITVDIERVTPDTKPSPGRGVCRPWAPKPAVEGAPAHFRYGGPNLGFGGNSRFRYGGFGRRVNVKKAFLYSCES
jgi:hypothetical protein